MPNLAAFPKAYMDQLCVDGTMSLREWFQIASSLEVDGVELYSGILDLADASEWPQIRRLAQDLGLALPMMCCSPDFTHPDAGFRSRQIEQQKKWIEMTAELGGQYCRVLSGQRRPELSRDQGIGLAREGIESCLPFAQAQNVVLILENHYKDNYWEFPEFVQQADDFCELVEQISSPWFGVNFDPSNAYLAGDDPLDLLQRVKRRVVTMHASDRYLAVGTLADLRREENSLGYAKRLQHGEIGKGLNDYDAIFRTLAEVGFDGWISIEDGVEGVEQLRGSVAFLRRKMAEHWPASNHDDAT